MSNAHTFALVSLCPGGLIWRKIFAILPMNLLKNSGKRQIVNLAIQESGGGIRRYHNAKIMVETGATRLGSSFGEPA